MYVCVWAEAVTWMPSMLAVGQSGTTFLEREGAFDRRLRLGQPHQ